MQRTGVALAMWMAFLAFNKANGGFLCVHVAVHRGEPLTLLFVELIRLLGRGAMSKIPGKMTRKQHWIPRFYLKGFSDSSGRLHVFRRESVSFFKSDSEGICASRDLYEVPYSDEIQSSDKYYSQNLIERRLSEMESRLAKAFDGLIKSCESGLLNEGVGEEGRLAICFLAANLIVRHPALLGEERSKAADYASSFEDEGFLTFKELEMLEWSGWCGDRTAVSELAIMSAHLLSNDKRVPQNRIYNSFADKNLCIMEAPVGSSFIATSFPLFVVGSDGSLDSYEFDYAFIPLCSRYGASFTNDDRGFYRNLNHEELLTQNVLLLSNCPNWDIAFGCGRGPLTKAIEQWRLNSL